MRCSGTIPEYLTWGSTLLKHEEQVYADVSVNFIESLLRLEPEPLEAKQIRALATRLLSGKEQITGASDCRALAPLLVLRFGDRRALPLLKRCFDGNNTGLSQAVLRSSAITYCSFGPTEVRDVRREASRRLLNHLADVVRLVERIKTFTSVPDRYKARLEVRYDSVAQTKYVDTRAVLTVRLLKLSGNHAVTGWIQQWAKNTSSQPISAYDRRFLKRLI